MRNPIGLVLDCHDPVGLASFWSEALGYTVLGGAGSYVLLVDAAGRGPKLLLQRVPEPKPAKNRMHLDIDTPTVDAEAERLEKLGATRSEDARVEHGSRWVVMADPEGNEFCVCDEGQPAPNTLTLTSGAPSAAAAWPDRRGARPRTGIPGPRRSPERGGH